MYGSPREYKEINSVLDDLNMGKVTITILMLFLKYKLEVTRLNSYSREKVFVIEEGFSLKYVQY